MSYRRLLRSAAIPLLALVGLFSLTACGDDSVEDMTDSRRKAVEASSHPLVQTFVDEGYRAVRLSRPNASSRGTVTLRKCLPSATFQECAKGKAVFDAPEVRVKVELNNTGKITKVVGLREFKAAVVNSSATRVWTCKFASNFADEDVTPAFMASVFRDFDGRNDEGDKELRIPTPTHAWPLVTLHCDHN